MVASNVPKRQHGAPVKSCTRITSCRLALSSQLLAQRKPPVWPAIIWPLPNIVEQCFNWIVPRQRPGGGCLPTTRKYKELLPAAHRLLASKRTQKTWAGCSLVFKELMSIYISTNLIITSFGWLVFNYRLHFWLVSCIVLTPTTPWIKGLMGPRGSPSPRLEPINLSGWKLTSRWSEMRRAHTHAQTAPSFYEEWLTQAQGSMAALQDAWKRCCSRLLRFESSRTWLHLSRCTSRSATPSPYVSWKSLQATLSFAMSHLPWLILHVKYEFL